MQVGRIARMTTGCTTYSDEETKRRPDMGAGSSNDSVMRTYETTSLVRPLVGAVNRSFSLQ